MTTKRIPRPRDPFGRAKLIDKIGDSAQEITKRLLHGRSDATVDAFLAARRRDVSDF